MAKLSILSTIELEHSELISVQELTISLLKERLKHIDRRQGAGDVIRRLKQEPEAKVLIVCHDNPDPDSLASAMAVKHICEHIGQTVTIAHGGLIEHQQNIGMVKLLEIDLRRIILSWEINDLLEESDIVICVDFNKSGANNILPKEFQPTIIIDHHFSENRPNRGNRTSETRICCYLIFGCYNFNEFWVRNNNEIATALAFGIRTDTLGFTRSFNEVDLTALSWLNKFVDWNLLRSFEIPPRSQDVLEIFKNALQDMYRENNLLLVPINNMANRDALSQVADFLLPTEGISTVISFGVRRNKVILSARSSDDSINLGQILESEFEEGTAEVMR